MDKEVNMTDKENGNILQFKVKTDTPVLGEDWLKKLKYGTRFLYRNKGVVNYELTEGVKASKFTKAILLGVNLDKLGGGFVWVDSQDFSKYKELYEVLEEPDEEAGNENGNSESDVPLRGGSEVYEHAPGDCKFPEKE